MNRLPQIVILACLAMVVGACNLLESRGELIEPDAVRPSVEAISERFLEFVDEAAGLDPEDPRWMDPEEAATWRDEVELLLRLVSDDVMAPVAEEDGGEVAPGEPQPAAIEGRTPP